VNEGLLLETIPGTMTVPFAEEVPRDTLHAQKQVRLEEQHGQDMESYEVEEEPVQEPFEFEETFDRSRVEEKLKYFESAMKEKNKKIKGKGIVTERPEREVITEEISIPDEEPGGFEKPVTAIAESSREQAPPEHVQKEKETDRELKDQAVDTQPEEERSIEQIVVPDTAPVEPGLLLTSLPDETAVPFEEEFERAGDRKEFQDEASDVKEADSLDREQPSDTVESKEDAVPDRERNLSEKEKIHAEKGKEVKERREEMSHQEIKVQAKDIPTEPLIERIVDMPFSMRTQRLGKSYQEKAQEEIVRTEDSAHAVAEAVEPENNKKSSYEEYGSVWSENNRQVPTEGRTTLQEGSGVGEQKPFIGIALPEVFFKKDLKIEISMNDPVKAEVSFQLLKKEHPLDEQRGSMHHEEIKLVEDTDVDYTEGYKRVFSTAKAEKGVYMFVIKNDGSQGYELDVLFFIFEGKSGERRKEYKTVALPPNTAVKYKFIIPEAVFWDDEDYFTGTIESSKTLTKFNEKTGLIWKEEKDH
jgi:hypothetical protein